MLDWDSLDVASLLNFDHSITTREYTGHEILDEVGLIHMNGRVYDPRLGRFLQADPLIQAASNTQSYNRYSYGFNNPLNGTDPSGYLFGIDDILVAFVVGYALGEAGRQFDIPALQAIGTAVSCIGGSPALCGAAAFSAVGEAFQGTGFWAEGGWGHIGAHALTGGVMSVLQGGKFGHGFVSAGFTKAINVNGIMPNDAGNVADTVRVVAAAIVGGIISEATGGKFANGAMTGTFLYAFNALSSKLLNAAKGRIRILNKKLAGGIHQKTGVRFSDEGFPIFDDVAEETVKIKMTGVRQTDDALAFSGSGNEVIY